MKIIRKIIIPLTIIVILFSLGYIIYLKYQLTNNQYLDESNEIIIEPLNNDEEIETLELYTIDIKGAIKNPGVYQVPKDYNVNDVIKIAGGLTNNADTSVINLAKKVSNEMVIIIYTKEEVKKSNIVDTVIKVVEKECICPNIQNDACLNTAITETITNQETIININTATIEQLQTINGIGQSKAKSIIEYREKNGKFNNIEELLKVDGIGQNLYEQIKIYITT